MLNKKGKKEIDLSNVVGGIGVILRPPPLNIRLSVSKKNNNGQRNPIFRQPGGRTGERN